MEGTASRDGRSPKVIRSYRLVFHRRWRIFRIQNWRIPLPGGVELRAVGYWLACLLAVVALGRVPGLGLLVQLLPSSLRFALIPLAGAWALSSWGIDGRSPHRAVIGMLAWRLRPRSLAALRHCPAVGVQVPTPGPVRVAADLHGTSYPRGCLRGPARVLLRYPVSVRAEGVPRVRGFSREQRIAQARRWRVRATGAGALQRGRVLAVPAGREVIFE
jgi:hypothetical protein